MDLFATAESVIKETKSIPVNYKTITIFDKAKGIIATFKDKEKFAIQLCCTSTDFLDAKVLGASLCSENEQAYFISLAENELFSVL